MLWLFVCGSKYNFSLTAICKGRSELSDPSKKSELTNFINSDFWDTLHCILAFIVNGGIHSGFENEGKNHQKSKRAYQ